MKRFARPGYILGVIAVAFAMSGSAVAASKITSQQIKDGTITGKDIKNYSVSTSKLTGGTMDDLTGPAGPAGPQGPAGPSAVAGLTPVSSAPVYFVPSSYAQSATATCPAGQRVVSGGGGSVSFDGLVASQANASRTGWFVVGGTDDPTFANQYVQAYALCAPANVAVASSAGNKARDQVQIERIAAQVNAQRDR